MLDFKDILKYIQHIKQQSTFIGNKYNYIVYGIKPTILFNELRHKKEHNKTRYHKLK